MIRYHDGHKKYALVGDRTQDLQLALCGMDYETDALPTELQGHAYSGAEV